MNTSEQRLTVTTGLWSYLGFYKNYKNIKSVFSRVLMEGQGGKTSAMTLQLNQGRVKGHGLFRNKQQNRNIQKCILSSFLFILFCTNLTLSVS